MLAEGEQGLVAATVMDAHALDDEDLLWYPPPDMIARLAVPCSRVPGVLALAHYTHGHTGVMALSCGCRKSKR